MDILRPTNFFFTTVLAFVLGALCGEPHQMNMLETIKRTTAEQSNLNSIVNLESLERSPTADGYRFTLRLTKNINPLRIIVQDNIVPPRTPDRLNQTPDGVWEISFVVPYNTAGRFPFPWMIISDRDVFHLVTIMLNNTGSSSASQNITELPVLFIDPAREATYDTDEDIVVSVFVPRNNETGQVIQSLPKMFTGLDLNSMRVYMDLDEEGVFTPGQPEERAGGISANITIHTSSRPISGYLQFSTGVEDTGGSVAMFIQVSRSIKVRPNSQQGVLPPGFLAIFDTPGAQTSSDGKELLPCRLGTECLMSCFSIGQNISGMDLKRILPDGTEQDVPSAQSHVMATSTSDGIFWTFEAEESSGDDNGITTFKCYVRDDVHGTEKTKVVGVQITIASSIDTNRSSVQVEDDPDDPTKRIVTFSCAVSGRPLPDIVFHGGSTGAFPIWDEAPDNIITVGNVETMATKTVTVDASALKRASNDINRERASSPDCTITEAFTGDFKQHFFSFPDLNQHTARY